MNCQSRLCTEPGTLFGGVFLCQEHARLVAHLVTRFSDRDPCNEPRCGDRVYAQTSQRVVERVVERVEEKRVTYKETNTGIVRECSLETWVGWCSKKRAWSSCGTARKCRDGGACHHGCAQECFREKHCGPLSGAFPNNEWPRE